VALRFIFLANARGFARSNAIAIGMMFLYGYAFGRDTGVRPRVTGLAMVAAGTAVVGIAIALGRRPCTRIPDLVRIIALVSLPPPREGYFFSPTWKRANVFTCVWTYSSSAEHPIR
jgi:hypothetical protein